MTKKTRFIFPLLASVALLGLTACEHYGTAAKVETPVAANVTPEPRADQIKPHKHKK